MRISPEKLSAEADATGFRPDLLEKVAHLLGVLDAIRSHPYLKGKLTLKGGTALNLFVFDVPRLSVDIDLNYTGAADRETMLSERPGVERALRAVFSREGLTTRRMPVEHAGGKWSLRYGSAAGEGGNLEVDVNFMYRIPLWRVTIRDSRPVGSWRAKEIPVMDIHELAGGKLTALLSRQRARDLFDGRQLLGLEDLDRDRLRTAFVVYGAMSRRDWRTVSPDDIDFDPESAARELAPSLRLGAVETGGGPNEYVRRLVQECRRLLSRVLPFTRAEREFLDRLLDDGEIDPSPLTEDSDLRERIRRHPLLEWKAINVRRHQFGSRDGGEGGPEGAG